MRKVVVEMIGTMAVDLWNKVLILNYPHILRRILSGSRLGEGWLWEDDDWFGNSGMLSKLGNGGGGMDDKLDPSEYATEDVEKIIEIALMCTQPTVSAKPAMSEVVILLSDKTPKERPPVRSTTTDEEVKIQVVMESTISNATASTIQLSGR
ncbi:probable LRR receptor-like serine/threonine-protein kinase At5g65240 [Helianthus annuus]|uniref:probable LRR receptor-like serine/threonine-protein kinase At5g65240 n=1 Tax=Helianthus annuus TaxID=4232 RepID=UPI000B8F89E4|nr:probable LRR receptor-like serine/threonine-protein kinase At5g65240 [Helianthus annuus]